MRQADACRKQLRELERYYGMGWLTVAEYESRKHGIESAIYQWEHGE
jgi:hypothetical protein